LRGGCRVVSNVGQEHHPLPGGWWRAVGGRRWLQCAQCLGLGTAYRGRCDAQGGRDVRGGYSGHGPQQDDLAVRGGQRGAQRTEPGALTGVDWSLAVLAGIWGSGRREDRRWRHRCTPRQGQRHRRDRPPHSSTEPPLRIVAGGRWIRWGRGPPEFVQANPRVPATPGGTPGASWVTPGGHPRGARPQTLRRSWHPHESPRGPVLGVSRRTLVDAGVWGVHDG
jgi:hypothetical protein